MSTHHSSLSPFMFRLVSRARANDKSVLVVCHRRMLGLDQQNRFKPCTYYLEGVNDTDNIVVCCANSLYKLPTRKWDVIIFDEAGLLRDHFVSPIMRGVLGRSYDYLKVAMSQAHVVVITQAELSQNDVEFFTNMMDIPSPNDRTRIKAFCIKKPI